MKIAIIGGGPAGLTAAYYAKDKNTEVHVLEKNSDVLKKLLLTGNGKCNYWNMEEDVKFFHSSDTTLLTNIITLDNLNKAFNFTKEIGIVPKVKNNYFYPFSGKASSVKSLLKKACEEKKVIFDCNTTVSDIKYKHKNFIINGEEYDKVIVATGSKAYPKTGSDGIGYEIAKSFGHKIVPVNPSLVQLVTKTGLEKIWTGIRADVVLEYYENMQFQKREIGEIQFTDYGLSGICIFNLSRNIRIGLNNKKEEVIKINFVPWFTKGVKEFVEYMDERSKNLKNRTISELCDGFIDYKLLEAILKSVDLKSSDKWEKLDSKNKEQFAMAMKGLAIQIVDTKGFENSQVCSGGIPLKEIDLNTFESLKQKGLYFCGEVVDVDGDCGGFNLSFAFLSGMLAGEGVKKDD